MDLTSLRKINFLIHQIFLKIIMYHFYVASLKFTLFQLLSHPTQNELIFMSGFAMLKLDFCKTWADYSWNNIKVYSLSRPHGVGVGFAQAL